MRPTRQEERRELLAEAGDDLSLRTAAGLDREPQATLRTAASGRGELGGVDAAALLALAQGLHSPHHSIPSVAAPIHGEPIAGTDDRARERPLRDGQLPQIGRGDRGQRAGLGAQA